MGADTRDDLSGLPPALAGLVAVLAGCGLIGGAVLWLWQAAPSAPHGSEKPYQVSLVAAPPVEAGKTGRAAASPPAAKASRNPPVQTQPSPKPGNESHSRREARVKPRAGSAPQKTPPQTAAQPRHPRSFHAPAARAHLPAPSHSKASESAAHPQAARRARLTKAFKHRVRSAVEAAARYPRAARMMGLRGQAQVAFDYKNGRVSNERISHSSGHVLLDRAALRAVRGADYPPAPDALRDKWLNFSIVIRFHGG